MKVLIPDGNCSWLLQTICMLCLMCTSCTLRIDVLEPMLFLPGLMGSMIESRATTGNPIPSYCKGKLTNEYEITWLSVTRAFHGECFAETMRLYLRNVTSVDSSFVESRTPPDNIYATSYIDPANVVTRSKTQYYAEFYEYLIGKGYELYKNLDAIAYDWRQSPYNFFQPGDYFDRLKSRIELMFNQNQGKKITLVGHSMGGATTALFLSSFVDSEWKEKYVKQFISIAGVYGGSVKALRAVTTGIGSVLSEYLTRIAKHLPGVHSLVPIGNSDELVVWGNSTVFQLGNQAYTADQIPQLYKDLNLEAYAPVIEQLRSVGYQKPPGVPVHCLMTVNVATMVGIIVHSKSADDLENPKFLEGLGDGTVPARSLQVCSSWAHAQSQPVQSQLFNSDHEKMVSDVAVWEYVFKSANGLEF